MPLSIASAIGLHTPSTHFTMPLPILCASVPAGHPLCNASSSLSLLLSLCCFSLAFLCSSLSFFAQYELSSGTNGVFNSELNSLSDATPPLSLVAALCLLAHALRSLFCCSGVLSEGLTLSVNAKTAFLIRIW